MPKIYDVEDELLDQIFDFMIRDFSKFALQLYSKTSSTDVPDGYLYADDQKAGQRCGKIQPSLANVCATAEQCLCDATITPFISHPDLSG